MRRSFRSGCGAVSCHVGLLVHFCRVAAALGRCACFVVCVSTPVMRVAVCLLYVSAVKRRRVAVLHVRHLRHSLAVCSCCVVVIVAAVVVVVVVAVVVPSACLHVHGVAVVAL
jgi:hypothetical protein